MNPNIKNFENDPIFNKTIDIKNIYDKYLINLLSNLLEHSQFFVLIRYTTKEITNILINTTLNN